MVTWESRRGGRRGSVLGFVRFSRFFLGFWSFSGLGIAFLGALGFLVNAEEWGW